MAATNPFKISDLVHKYGWDAMTHISSIPKQYIHTDCQVLFVDVNHTDASDVDDTEHGHLPSKPLASVSYAVSLCTTNAVIIVARGDYDETETIAITVNGVKILGPGPDTQNKAMIYDGAAGGYDLMTINANEVVIDGLAFSAAGDTFDGIVVAGSVASYKVAIRNCRFDGWSGEYGIQAGGTLDCPDLLIENNLFRSWNTAAVRVNGTRSCVRNNIFHVVTDKIGLEHIPAGGNRPDNVYLDNVFSGIANSSTTGIKFTGAPNNGTIMIGRNMFFGTWDTSITTIAAHGGVNNYVADAAGGALIDTVTN